MPRVVLASSSPYRASLLRRLGIAFETCSPGVDETPLQRQGLAPQAMVSALARAKAEAVAAQFEGAVVIGSDQCAALGQQTLGKPGTAARAQAQLEALQGRVHDLWTAVCVLGPDGRRDETVDLHRMAMRTLSAAQIAHYVETERPLDCAGAYKIEGLGVALFDRVDGADGTAIIGLPLMWVARTLAAHGVDVLSG